MPKIFLTKNTVDYLKPNSGIKISSSEPIILVLTSYAMASHLRQLYCSYLNIYGMEIFLLNLIR